MSQTQVKLGYPFKQFNWLDPRPPDIKSGTLTTQSHHLLIVSNLWSTCITCKYMYTVMYLGHLCVTLHLTGLKKVPSHCRGQVDLQVTFHSYTPNGQGIRQFICQINH